MKLPICLICACICLLTGCAVTTTITMPDGDVYVVQSKADALVEFSEGDKKVIVDNRGRPSFLEVFFSTLIMRSPEMNIHTGNETN